MSLAKELESVTNQVLAKIQHYGRLIGIVALLVFILLTIARLYGVTLWPIATFGAQETGLLVAGLAYALKG